MTSFHCIKVAVVDSKRKQQNAEHRSACFSVDLILCMLRLIPIFEFKLQRIESVGREQQNVKLA